MSDKLADKPKFRIPAGSSKTRYTSDSFQNFAASLGYGANNVSSGATYGFNPISRNHTLLEWAYRGSWLVKQIVDAPAEDMTRAGIDIESDMPPDEVDKLHQYINNLNLWQDITSTLKWGRLYGGCIAIMMIDGQKPETPLNIDTIGKDQFKGLLVADRWTVWPHVENPVLELGRDYGKPTFYEIVSDAKAMPHMKVHYSRCIRFDGMELPYWQRIAENGWGLSVIEPLYDRLLAFDSTSQGAAQLVYRCSLRTLKIERLRDLIAFGGEGYSAINQQLQMIRLMQSNEGLTVLDSTDDFESHSYTFAGLSDLIDQFSQQLSGAAQIPLTRLFGQAPAGLNSTGESDLRNYYDAINAQQEARMRGPISKLLSVCHRSLFGRPLPEGFDFSFAPLWQMTNEEKANIASTITNAVAKATEDMIITPAIALKELRQQSKITGIYTNISDEDIQTAEEQPPPSAMLGTAPEDGQEGQGSPVAPPGEKTLLKQPAGNVEPSQKVSDNEDDPEDHRAKLPPTTREHVAKMFSKDSSCVVGPDNDSQAAWIVVQQDSDTDSFGEFRFLVGFADRDEALQAYGQKHDASKIGSVKRTTITEVEEILKESPTYMNGAS